MDQSDKVHKTLRIRRSRLGKYKIMSKAEIVAKVERDRDEEAKGRISSSTDNCPKGSG